MRFAFGILHFFILYSLFVLPASAQSAITVTPQLVRVDLAKDTPEALFYYKNNTSGTIELTFTIQDVTDLSDSGIPTFLEGNDAENYKYGLASWAQSSSNSMILSPGEEKSVKVFIDKTRLPQGGHYGALLAEIQNLEEEGNVKLRAMLAALIFVRSGSEFNREDAKVLDLANEGGLIKFPRDFFFRFQNTGNVDVTPHGLLTIKDIFGREVGRSAVNEGSLTTLPETIRRYKTIIKPHHTLLIPGVYRAHLQLRYGQSEKRIEENAYFVTLGSGGISTIIIIVIIIGGIIFIARQKKLNH